ncbi:DUF3365 domain-containing protein [Adlercreutzia sp. R25]|uniref:ATP-binding protein n=1 Tax=Adlercreutzia shanghongiae TaxID=3111773 RepID=UPI002DB75443|nr:DUF3365 domain-containing protein [Adlercreutzia sp. R25]MEC4273613.1 DUF3365 domain-containing protein [Adlercreutzia sp. R25]
MGHKRLSWWFTGALLFVLFAVIGVYSLWSTDDQRIASEEKVLGEARLLAEQMAAAWDYVDTAQNAINYNSDGRYDFKGVYCSVAGKSIARNFSQNTDCVVRYTRENPRTGPDAPDAFEAEALAHFEEGETEYYDVVSVDGESTFRYLRAIPVKYGCLTCHGEPAGELDETGFPREGYQLGDLAGAVSLAIPMKLYEEEAAARTAANVSLFVALAALIVACAVAVNTVLGRQSRQIEAMNKKLEQTNEHLAQVNDALVKESEYKSTFLATMSHELKTPLASTIALVDVWERDRERGREGQSQESLMAEIRRNSANLLATINNTLDAASLEADRYRVDIVPLDILDAVNAVEQTVEPLAREKSVAFEALVDPSFPLVMTDSSIVHKVLMNLLSNAVKFTEPGGSVNLKITLEEDRSHMRIVVSDTGIGIPEDELSFVFERFRQADQSISRRYGGSGLGLALVKEMAELLGGSAGVESVVGEGSVFCVVIPCKAMEEQ